MLLVRARRRSVVVAAAAREVWVVPRRAVQAALGAAAMSEFLHPSVAPQWFTERAALVEAIPHRRPQLQLALAPAL